ncbi:MAG: sigma-54-dependent Fis family transcriptional regulator, partial [Deltaproteobacteria bacterium]|nr:sigma-54-dependent Fis family transcriptional regulator [Deltaproteobacteria bacterium]
MTEKATILVVDDEHGVRQSFNMLLKDAYDVLLAETGEEAIRIFSKYSIDIILLDIRLPDIDGLDLLTQLKEADPNTEIIMVTAVKEIQTAVKSIKSGAYQYIIKPFFFVFVLGTIRRALEKRSLVKEVTYLRNELERHHTFEKMLGKHKKMREIFDLISIISQSDGTVLIQGESGTGKELVARAIHNRSPRRDQPFVVLNCAAIPPTLMESETFGHNRGAFTGAIGTNIGKLEIADGGTVFLDDIDSLDFSMQGKLLRIIQEREFERLGSTKIIRVDLRFVAASNKQLDEMISRREFREDLFFRLNVFPVHLPPLREKKSDIPLLINHFLELNAKKTGKPPKKFATEAIKALKEYDWPGNVRELQNLVERLFTITRDNIIQIKNLSTFNHLGKRVIKDTTLKEAVNTFEKQFIDNV